MAEEYELEEPQDNLGSLNPRTLAERAYPVFQRENWVYYDGPVTVDRLEETIVGLIDTVVMEPEPNAVATTGRIVVEKEYDEEGFTEWKVYLDLVDPADVDE